MKHHFCHNAKRLLPFLLFSAAAGFLSAVFCIAFKFGAEGAIHLSSRVYAAVRQNPVWIPVLAIGAAALGLYASVVVSFVPSCKGGGIPSSVAAIGGTTRFNWWTSIFILPFTALLTFFCGLPLGTEGPCVQMGTAIGDGVVHCFGAKKHSGWRRYIMTGGASAGFSIATASPVSAILFSVEELHKKFSPLLLTGVSVSVMTAQATAQLLALLGIESGRMFHLSETATLPAEQLFIPLLIGVVCGLGSVLFTRCYHMVDKAVHTTLQKVSVKIVFPMLFACIALVGVGLADALGTGHALTEEIFRMQTAGYLLILVFLIRAAFMMVSNTAGVTGGLFLPTLAFGAILGSLCAEGMIAAGLLQPQDRLLMVILGVTAFLGATSRIPLTACVFAVEALNGGSNILAIIMATTVAFLIAKLSGVEDFTDAVIKAKVRSLREKMEPVKTVSTLTVKEHAFAVGKELHDILWPHDCTVISVARAPENCDSDEICPGDMITVYYTTYDPVSTAKELEVLVGSQPKEMRYKMR